MEKEWIWMPHAGHLIIANECRFHLNTFVNGYIVSTVGEWWPDQEVRRIFAKISSESNYRPKKMDMSLKGDAFDHEYLKVFGFKEIGLDRIYETMVFKAKKYEGERKCCPYIMSNGEDLDFRGYTESEDAFKGHYEMCKKYDAEPSGMNNG